MAQGQQPPSFTKKSLGYLVGAFKLGLKGREMHKSYKAKKFDIAVSNQISKLNQEFVAADANNVDRLNQVSEGIKSEAIHMVKTGGERTVISHTLGIGK